MHRIVAFLRVLSVCKSTQVAVLIEFCNIGMGIADQSLGDRLIRELIMNRMLAVSILGAMVCTSVQATTIFSPTDSTVNFIQLFGVNNALIGLFDDRDLSFAGDYLAIQTTGSGDQVLFTPSGSDYLLTSATGLTPDALSLTGSSYFSLAAWSPLWVDWVRLDAAYCDPFSGSCSIFWSDLPLVELVVDITKVEPVIPTPPLPASVSLLGFGALGLVAMGRRRVY